MPAPTPHYGPATEADIPALARLISHAFAGPLEGSRDWIINQGLTDIRVVRTEAGSPPEACLRRIDMGQYLGGRPLRMAGIAGVAVAPESRGRGLARAMMREALREAAGDGFAISTLYASTQALYRSVGYEQAGHSFNIHIPVHRIDVAEHAGDVRPLTDADQPEIEACYGRFARSYPGMLARGRYVWSRIREWRGEKHHPFGVRDQRGQLTGYLYLSQRRRETDGRHDIHLTDAAFSTAHAGRRLLAFLGQFGTMAHEVHLAGGPMHPWLHLLGEKKFEVTLKEYWMVRVLDVARAIESRGWNPALKAELQLTIADDLIPANAGNWTIRVENGRGSARRSGEPSTGISLDVRALAPLLFGFMSARELALAGRLSGPDAAMDAADALFAGPTPWMTDFF